MNDLRWWKLTAKMQACDRTKDLVWLVASFWATEEQAREIANVLRFGVFPSDMTISVTPVEGEQPCPAQEESANLPPPSALTSEPSATVSTRGPMQNESPKISDPPAAPANTTSAPTAPTTTSAAPSIAGPYFVDISSLSEDTRIDFIGSLVMDGNKKIAFSVPDDGQCADRYVIKLVERFKGIIPEGPFPGPVRNTILVKVGPPQ
jgi:hypothetical protein